MSQDRVRLLTHVVYQQFGTAVGEVASLLLARGSLRFGQLAALSALPQQYIYSSLLILSIHGLLYHSESEINGRLVELYEMNETAVEQRIHGGLYVDMAREWDPTSGLDVIVESLWQHGMQRKDSLIEQAAGALLERDSAPPPPLEPGKLPERLTSKSMEPKYADFAAAKKAAAKTLRRAFAEGYVCIVTPGSQLSPSSLEIKWEEELRRAIQGIPSTKDLAENKGKLMAKQEEWAREELDRSRGGTGDADAKRSIYIDGVSELPDIPPGAFLRICADQFHIRWRAQLMEQFARERYNDTVALVFGLVLKISDRYCTTLQEAGSKQIGRAEIQQQWENIPSSKRPKLSAVFGTDSRVKSFKPDDMRDGDLLLEILYLLSDADTPGFSDRPTLLNQHGEGPGSKWSVNYDLVGGWMKKSLVEATIKSKLDGAALLCWRILQDKGKLDEKHLARLAFLPVKDAREAIGRLSNSDLIEAQEVPRSADRAPSRTIYLWGVNYHRVVSTLLDHNYKALANLQAQKEHKLEENATIIDKRDRRDVRDDPTLLSKHDRALIAKMDGQLEALAVAEARIAAQVFVMSELDNWIRR